MSMITDSGDEYEYWQSTQYLEPAAPLHRYVNRVDYSPLHRDVNCVDQGARTTAGSSNLRV